MGWRILVASVQLAVIVLSPRMPLQPCTVRFRTSLTRPLARATLSNAISLVPGTLTVDIDGDLIVVHALSPHQLDDLVSGRLQNKVAAMFFEAPQSAVDPATIEEGDLP
jgi:multicomponent Na+:H+ antiporter subunit E